MSLRPALAAAAAIGLAASPALGATLAQTSGSFTLEAVGGLPDGIVITVLDPIIEADADSAGPLSQAGAAADGAGTPDPEGVDFGEVSALARADTTGGGETGSAIADAFVDIAIFVENTTQETLTATGLLEYELDALVEVDDPLGDGAFASVMLEFLILGDVLFADAVELDGPGRASVADSLEIPLTLPGGFGAEVAITLDTVAAADDVSPVPVPAALPLLGAALAGLGFLRRRVAC